jgi:hypothetical protein
LDRIQDTGQIAFGRIAPAAGVQEVVVIADLASSKNSRAKMLDAEGVFAVRAPSFAAKAVHATELKLVPQPRLVA